MAWDFLDKMLSKKKEEAKPVPPEVKIPPTPFYASHVPRPEGLAATKEPSLYRVDESTMKKQRSMPDPVEMARLKERYKNLPMNVGVGPYPTRRSQNKGNKIYQTKPGTVKLARGD